MAVPLNTQAGSEAARSSAPERELEELEIDLLLEAVYRRYGLDFRQYAQASLKRRLYRRLHAEGLETLSQLQDRLLHIVGVVETGLFFNMVEQAFIAGPDGMQILH